MMTVRMAKASTAPPMTFAETKGFNIASFIDVDMQRKLIFGSVEPQSFPPRAVEEPIRC